MPATAAPDPRILPAPREQYLRQNETRIRSLALPQNTSDPVVAVHLNIVLWMEDEIDIHEIAETKFRNQGANAVADTHRLYAARATQTKLYHLDKLAHLVV